jgi:hypothetical protein
MKRSALLIVSIIAIVWIVPASAFGQGRGRGIGLGRQSDVFVNNHDARLGRWDGRGPQIGSRTILVAPRNRGRGIGLARKSRFINGHDARDGRFDGRGPRMNRGFFRNGIFIPRGSRVRHRMIVRDSDSDQFRRTERLNRLEMLRRERIAEQRRFGNRSGWRRP